AIQEYQVEGMRILATRPKDPCFRSRCLELLFRRGESYLAEFPVTVNLTTRTVRVGRGIQGTKKRATKRLHLLAGRANMQPGGCLKWRIVLRSELNSRLQFHGSGVH